MSLRPSAPVAYRTAADVATAGLCCICGMCAAVCPRGAISLTRRGSFPWPEVDQSKCAACGLCLAVCPGIGVDLDALNAQIFGVAAADPLLGSCLKFAIGAVSEPAERGRRTSGGLATAVMVYGLEKRLWQAAVVSTTSPEAPLVPKTYLARTVAEIRATANSLYCPVPACAGLAALRDFDGRACFVGLPCHIHALRQAQQRLPWLREKVPFVIGLFCSSLHGFFATEAFLRYHRIDPAKVTLFAYKSTGWPKMITVQVRGERRPRRFARGRCSAWLDRLRYAGAFQPRSAFVNPRCFFCPDHLARLADLSLGDVFLPEYIEAEQGHGLAIMRTPMAVQLLEELCGVGRVFLEEIPPERAVAAQRSALAAKCRVRAHLTLAERAGRPFPNFSGVPNLPMTSADRWLAWIEWQQTRLATRREMWWLLPYLAPLVALAHVAGKLHPRTGRPAHTDTSHPPDKEGRPSM